MTIKHLLPHGSTLLEQRAAEITRLALQNPIIIADLINPERCPLELLPYLAWAFSVDKWDEDWSEEVKRIAIKHSFQLHKSKGTIAAIKRVVEPIGYLIELTEWFEMKPQGKPGTFTITVEVQESGLNEQTYNELIRLTNDVKPVSRHLTRLAITTTPTGTINVFSAPYMGEIITIYPQG